MKLINCNMEIKDEISPYDNMGLLNDVDRLLSGKADPGVFHEVVKSLHLLFEMNLERGGIENEINSL